ncbi:MAG: hypothetical protein HZC28_04980 [Spirochaetes bacterium]|nr:hypothetical protein [Spirochaetota bacterium]
MKHVFRTVVLFLTITAMSFGAGLGFAPLENSLSLRTSADDFCYWDFKLGYDIIAVGPAVLLTATPEIDFVFRPVNNRMMKFFIGAGIFMENYLIGLSMPLGVEFFIPKAENVSISAYANPAFFVVGYFQMKLRSGVSVHYYFDDRHTSVTNK